ncbi:MAG: LysM peptidoglycan-binding domain-containing protein [Ignavibacteriales bacterium]|nr:LysM peptidoglycan-binding domain-containing protein [Ignavibacteriales bacterium]
MSQKTGIPVNQLKAANGVKGDIIRPGQKIKIPAKKK